MDHNNIFFKILGLSDCDYPDIDEEDGVINAEKF